MPRRVHGQWSPTSRSARFGTSPGSAGFRGLGADRRDSLDFDEIDGHLRHASGVDLVSAVAWPLVDGAAHGIVAFVGARAIEHEKVIDTLKARIPAYMMPRRVIAMQHLPLNAGGKVDRLALRRLLADEQL